MPIVRCQDVEVLFSRENLSDRLDELLGRADEAVEAIDGNQLLVSPIEDLVAAVAGQCSIEVLTLHEDHTVMEEPAEISCQIEDYGSLITVPGERYQLTIPFTGDTGLWRHRPSSGLSMPPSAKIFNKQVFIRVEGYKLSADEVGIRIRTTLAEIKQYLNWQKGMIDPFLARVERHARKALEVRKKRILDSRSLVGSIGFPLRRRADTPATYVAPVVRKRVTPQRQATNSQPTNSQPFKPEPAMREGDYQEIIKFIESMALTMERNPSTFLKLDEEQLRDMYLVPLNGAFEGAATGETFNAAGKTDISIRVEDRNIFIAECKIWRGPKYLTEAIDQLLRYLTWRDTKTAIIVFNRNKDFSSVLSSIKETMNAHANRKHGPKVEGETRFRYVFGHPNDANREIIVTVLAFDVPI